MVLVCGAILAPGRRTVAASLRVMGFSQGADFSKYHRVLNRAQWSTWLLSKRLLALIMMSFLAPGQSLLLAIDDTLERRKGKKLTLKGWFRDPLSKTGSKVSAIRWVCLAILVPVPWSKRHWALPFMTVPAPSEKVCKKLGKRHKTPIAGPLGPGGSPYAAELASLLTRLVRSWHPRQDIILLADGGYAAVSLVQNCQKLGVTLISRLRLDARVTRPALVGA
jgi:hypothetical protein